MLLWHHGMSKPFPEAGKNLQFTELCKRFCFCFLLFQAMPSREMARDQGWTPSLLPPSKHWGKSPTQASDVISSTDLSKINAPGDVLCFQPGISQQPMPFWEVQQKPGFSLCCSTPMPTTQAASSSSKYAFVINILTDPLKKQKPVPLEKQAPLPQHIRSISSWSYGKSNAVFFLSETRQKQWKGWIVF